MKTTPVLGAALAASLRFPELDTIVVDAQHVERDEPKLDRIFISPAWQPRTVFKVKRVATPTGFFWVVKGDPSCRRFRLKADAEAHLTVVEKAR